ncbi:MAG TPA: hypothetical protein VHT02_00625 [Methylocella sp.]|nr:hypothetical protein [Methylocella sp.]
MLVGYQNGVAKDGSDGKASTIVQYSLTGTVQRSFQVRGHNDGLRLVGTNSLWALQNEDANPRLVVFDLSTGTRTRYLFPPTPHGGGYDDIVVQNGRVFITASNPTLDAKGVNVFPALLQIILPGSGGGTVLLGPVLQGNAKATDIPTGSTVTLNLTDPDSLSADQRGNIVLDDQADAQLVFIRNPVTKTQTASRINITDTAGKTTTLDDTAFVPVPQTFMLVADVTANKVYRIDQPSLGFEPGIAYSTSDTAGIVGQLNLDNGVITPIATGFISTLGMIFVPLPVK